MTDDLAAVTAERDRLHEDLAAVTAERDALKTLVNRFIDEMKAAAHGDPREETEIAFITAGIDYLAARDHTTRAEARRTLMARTDNPDILAACRHLEKSERPPPGGRRRS